LERPSLLFSLPSNEMRRLVTFTFAMLFPVLARAAQVIPTGVEYTNDTIEKGGRLAACIVTTAIISPPAPEIVNFQFLLVGGTHAFKVAAGDVDWTKGSGVAKRISAADFSTAQFNHPSAFKKKHHIGRTASRVLAGAQFERRVPESFLRWPLYNPLYADGSEGRTNLLCRTSAGFGRHKRIQIMSRFDERDTVRGRARAAAGKHWPSHELST
jgi:hypothetical protein